MPAPGGTSPMANYIGAPGGGGMMQHPAMPPVAAPTQLGGGMQGGAPGAGGMMGGADPAKLMGILAQLRGGQTGVQPGQAGVPGNTPSALTQGANGMWGGTPGQPPPMQQQQMGPHGAPNFAALQQAGAFQPPPGGMPMQPGGMPGGAPGGMGAPQMTPDMMQRMQWLHGLFSGGGGAGGGAPPQGAGGGGFG